MNRINFKTLRGVMPRFQEFLNTEGKQWIEEREEKDRFFAKYFSVSQIDQLEEGTLRELIHILWSYSGWTNKDYILEDMLQSSLPAIRSAFKYLLYSDDPVAKRFDHVKNNIRKMGVASISEILAHHDHEKFAISNRRSRQGLISLGIEEAQLPPAGQFNGSQYESFCQLARDVRAEIAKEYPEIVDLFKLDFLLYFISLQKLTFNEPPSTKIPNLTQADFDHGAVIDQLLELGDGLGFEVAKEFPVVRGCRIDAIWRSRVANLGTIAYAFEVHRKGSMDSAILNLQRVRRDPTVQKVVLVSSKIDLDKFRGEIESLDESFRTSVGYFDVEDLQRALDHLQGLKDILNTLGLLSKVL